MAANFLAHLESQKKKRRLCDDLKEHISKVKSVTFQDLNECSSHMEPEEVACVLAIKLGPRGFLWISDMLAGLHKVPNKMKETIEDGLFQAVGLPLSGKEKKDAFAALRKAQSSLATRTGDLSLRLCEITKLPLNSQVLCPPTDTCLDCGSVLSNHNKPVEVTLFTADRGAVPALKVSLKCNICKVNYNYAKYGSTETGYRFYENQREHVEATDCSFFQRTLCLSQIYLSNHAWVSFTGFTEAYNETFINQATLLDRRVTSRAFFNHEIESEMRERGTSFVFFGSDDKSMDDVLDFIEERRRQEIYPHSKDQCAEMCRRRGCTNFVSMDGVWKLRHPHCMYPVKAEVSGLPSVNYPNVCTQEPQSQTSAFCKEHNLLAQKKHIPTNLREFVHSYCGVKQHEGHSLDDPSNINLSDVERVEEIVSKLDGKDDLPSTVSEAQGTTEFLKEHHSILKDCEDSEDSQPACNKDTGEKQKVLRKWSRGLFHFVRGGGHIDQWNPLYVSEGPGQVFVLTITYLLERLKDVPEAQYEEFLLSYDNMCNLCRLKASKKPLPLPRPYDQMWLKISKIIDGLHIKNHKNPDCLVKYNPAPWKEQFPGLNTPVAEQTFTWASRFKKIMCAMPKRRFLFFYHRMVVRRNNYLSHCYQNSREPVMPKVHS